MKFKRICWRSAFSIVVLGVASTFPAYANPALVIDALAMGNGAPTASTHSRHRRKCVAARTARWSARGLEPSSC